MFSYLHKLVWPILDRYSGYTNATLKARAILRRAGKPEDPVAMEQRILYTDCYLVRMDTTRFAWDESTFCGEPAKLLRWMNFRMFGAWVDVEDNTDASPGEPTVTFSIRPTPRVTIVSPCLKAGQKFTMVTGPYGEPLAEFSMDEAAAKQLCALYVPHVNSIDNVLRGAKDALTAAGRALPSTWSATWHYYAKTPCPWEVMFPGMLVGFEPPGIADANPGERRSVRRPVEDTRMPVINAIPDTGDETERLVEVHAAELAGDAEVQPISGPLVDLAPFRSIPAEEAAGIATKRKFKGASLFSNEAPDDEMIPSNGPLPAPPGYKFHGSGGFLSQEGGMDIARKWYKDEVVESRKNGTNNLMGPRHRAPDPECLNAGQRDVYDDYKSSPFRHCFLTGDAGTGKSLLTRELIAMLATEYVDPPLFGNGGVVVNLALFCDSVRSFETPLQQRASGIGDV
jgi:hypothetical protein